MSEYQVLLFAGTTEGREIAEFLRRHRIRTRVCMATEYGGSLIQGDDYLEVSHHRMDEGEMEEAMGEMEEAGALVIDATHPYAAQVTANIQRAAKVTKTSYLRILRESTEKRQAERVYVDSAQEAAAWLNCHEGKALLTTGSKELSCFTEVEDFANRLYARVLSLPEVARQCAELGFRGSHLICMQGPFSEELNAAMIRQYGIRYLVSKDTGLAGGFPEKEAAAAATGAVLVVIGRPLKEQGVSVWECIHALCRRFGIGSDPEISLVGIGLGGPDGMTGEALKACRSAQLLVGAERMLEGIALPGQEILAEYRAEKIRAYLEEHPEYERVAVLLSGDTGFRSGAKRLLELWPDRTRVRVYPGISSLAAFAARLGVSWDDAKLVSAHGQRGGLVGAVSRNCKVFSLLGEGGQVRELCQKLVRYGMEEVRICVGERLSYPDERITEGFPADFLEFTHDNLAVLYAENPHARTCVTPGIPDGQFLRAQAPMTKEEVRQVSVCKLRLAPDSVVYDVGAGSGSVSVEMALAAGEGRVYAVEKKPEAVALLRKNKEKFGADNMEIVEGCAPEALAALPAPTHAFIGGSSGNLREICRLLLEKNPSVRIVINAITLETVGEALAVLKEFALSGAEIVQLSAARAKQAGPYHMMMGQNPVYIISGGGEEP